jgi:N-acetylglutamate synthase-like GNAT family acetyltransferase
MGAAISAAARLGVVQKRTTGVPADGAAARRAARIAARRIATSGTASAPTRKRSSPAGKSAGAPPVRLRGATLGDHPAIEELLSAAGPASAREWLAASVEHPDYQPAQRLLVDRAGSVLAHVHLQPRLMQLGAAQVPLGVLSQLVALPEPQGPSYDAALVRAASRVLTQRKVPLALLTTREASRYESFGWTQCPGSTAVQTSTRSLLSRLAMRGVRAESCQLNIRPWRQIELPALAQLHAQNTTGSAGAVVRDERDWRWLIATGLFDRIYVALAAEAEVDGQEPRIAAYAVIRDDRILELMELPEPPAAPGSIMPAIGDVGRSRENLYDGLGAAEHLLARIASESIERDSHALRLHSPHASRLQDLFADGASAGPNSGRQLLARVNDPALLLRQLEGELLQRAGRGGLSLPCEIGLDAAPLKLLVRLSRRGLQLRLGKLGRSYLRLNQATLTQLLLGMADATAAVESGTLFASTRLALETAQILFPALAFWSSPWDHIDG